MRIGGGGGGGGGFQVVMGDLLDASDTFRTEAATFRGIMPAAGPPCPNAGGGGVDGSLQAVLNLIGAAHLQAAGVMENDSAKLRTAHGNYASSEESLTQLCGQISDPAKIK